MDADGDEEVAVMMNREVVVHRLARAFIPSTAADGAP